MAIYDEVTHKFLCECGCRTEVPPWNSYVSGGHRRWTSEEKEKISLANSDTYQGFRSEEFRKKQSEIMLQVHRDDPTIGDRISKSKEDMVMDDAYRKACSDRQTLLWQDPEYREKQSEAFSGKIVSDEARRNISLAMQRFLDSDEGLEYREKQAERSFMRLHSPETIDKIRELKLEWWASEEGKKQKQKLSEDRIGEGNPAWKGGMWGDYGYGWSTIRDCILVRDNRICQGCGYSAEEVHHIDSNPVNIDEKNLIAVCHSCNMKAAVKKDMDYWLDYHTDKIGEIYRGGL